MTPNLPYLPRRTTPTIIEYNYDELCHLIKFYDSFAKLKLNSIK